MSERVQQVNHLLKEEVGLYLQEHLTSHAGVLTITAVETSGDMRHAVIWYGYVGNDLGTVKSELGKHTRDIQKHVNKRLSMKNVPKLEFRYDQSGDYAIDISKIIDAAK